MANAANRAPDNTRAAGAKRLGSYVASALTTFGRDVGSGALSTAKLIVMVSGCAALLAAGVLTSSSEARARLMARLPSVPVVTIVETESAAAAANVDYQTPTAATDPQQKRIVQYLARRYRVADEAVRQLVSAAFQIGKEKNLDPLLILSVVAIESSLNPFAESAMGAQGLMQVMTRVHAQRFAPHGGETAALDPIANMKVGSSILHESITRGGSVERGLQLYVGAGNLPDDGGYGVRVLGERGRLQMAAAGKVDSAIAAAVRAAAPAPVAVEAKPASIPLRPDAAPNEPTFLQPLPSSTSEAPRDSERDEQSV